MSDFSSKKLHKIDNIVPGDDYDSTQRSKTKLRIIEKSDQNKFDPSSSNLEANKSNIQDENLAIIRKRLAFENSLLKKSIIPLREKYISWEERLSRQMNDANNKENIFNIIKLDNIDRKEQKNLDREIVHLQEESRRLEEYITNINAIISEKSLTELKVEISRSKKDCLKISESINNTRTLISNITNKIENLKGYGIYSERKEQEKKILSLRKKLVREKEKYALLTKEYSCLNGENSSYDLDRNCNSNAESEIVSSLTSQLEKAWETLKSSNTRLINLLEKQSNELRMIEREKNIISRSKLLKIEHKYNFSFDEDKLNVISDFNQSRSDVPVATGYNPNLNYEVNYSADKKKSGVKTVYRKKYRRISKINSVKESTSIKLNDDPQHSRRKIRLKGFRNQDDMLDVKKICTKYGEIVEYTITNSHLDVTFKDYESAKNAIIDLNGQICNQTILSIDWAANEIEHIEENDSYKEPDGKYMSLSLKSNDTHKNLSSRTAVDGSDEFTELAQSSTSYLDINKIENSKNNSGSEGNIIPLSLHKKNSKPKSPRFSFIGSPRNDSMLLSESGNRNNFDSFNNDIFDNNSNNSNLGSHELNKGNVTYRPGKIGYESASHSMVSLKYNSKLQKDHLNDTLSNKKDARIYDNVSPINQSSTIPPHMSSPEPDNGSNMTSSGNNLSNSKNFVDDNNNIVKDDKIDNSCGHIKNNIKTSLSVSNTINESRTDNGVDESDNHNEVKSISVKSLKERTDETTMENFDINTESVKIDDEVKEVIELSKTEEQEVRNIGIKNMKMSLLSSSVHNDNEGNANNYDDRENNRDSTQCKNKEIEINKSISDFDIEVELEDDKQYNDINKDKSYELNNQENHEMKNDEVQDEEVNNEITKNEDNKPREIEINKSISDFDIELEFEN